MTIWTPSLGEHDGPLYRAIADQLEAAIVAGELPAGARLPTHRDLARRLSVTVGTVSRAYGEAQRRGLLLGEVGRGTFVRDPGADEGGGVLRDEAAAGTGFVDLGINVPPSGDDAVGVRAMAATLAEMAGAPAGGTDRAGRATPLSRLLGYVPHGGVRAHRAAGAEWIRRHGVEVDPEQVLVTCGAQHALAVVLTAMARCGDPVLAESLTYPGFLSLADLLQREIEPVAIDRDGLRVDALEAALDRSDARLLYVVPTIQNPTGGVLPIERRRKIAELARRRELWILEDDVHGRLPASAPPPIAALAPERTFYVANTSKSIAPGLRVGYLAAPASEVERLSGALWSTAWMTAPLMGELAARWIDDGTAERLLDARRAEARARQELAARILGDQSYDAHPDGYHLWLYLPRTWRYEELVLEARRRGVGVTPPTAFRVGRGAVPRAVRVCLGAAPDRRVLARGLEILAALLREAPAPRTGLA